MMLRKSFTALMYFYIFLLVNSAFLPEKILLLQDVLRIRNANYITFYNCWEYADAASINKVLHNNSIMTSFEKIGENLLYEFKFFSHSVNFVLDATCKGMENVLTQFNNKYEFGGYNKWYILTEEDTVENIFNKLILRMDSDVLLLNYKTFTTIDLYNSGAGGIVLIPSENSHHNRREVINFPRAINTIRYKKRSDMSNVHLRVFLNVTTVNYTDSVHKLSLALITTLQKIHNFTTIYVAMNKPSVPKSFVTQNESDVLGPMLFVSEEVIAHYDLVMPAYPFRQCFVYKRLKTTKNIYLAPFASSVWYCVLSLAILVCVAMKLVLNLENESRLDGEVSWTSALLITISVYSQQGTSIVPRHTAGRIIVFCLLIISVHLYNSYVSIIVSSLLYPTISTYGSPTELVRDGFELGFEDLGFNPFFKYNGAFVFSNDGIQFKNERFNYHDVPEGLRKIRSGQFAFHTEVAGRYSIIFKTFTPAEICELQEFDVFRKVYLTLVAPKHSQYTEMFKISYRRMAERGILAREILASLAEKPLCLANSDVKQLSFKDVLPAFVAFAFGIAIAMFFFLLEFTVFYVMEKNV